MRRPNSYSRAEWSGSCGDLGTLIPFVVGYITIVGIDPQAVLLSVGGAAIATGVYFRTPMSVQPMKAIATAAIAQAGAVTIGMVWVSTVLTALLWLGLGVTGAVSFIARLTRKPVVRGLTLGLGLTFVVEGARLMRDAPILAAIGLAITLLLLAQPRIPAMVVLLVYGVAISLWSDAGLWQDLVAVRPALRLSTPAWPTVSIPEVVRAVFLLVLPQAALTVGNAVLATAEEHNRLFPEREVTVRELAFDHAALNAFAATIGGVPMCRGAGGMAGHIRFGGDWRLAGHPRSDAAHSCSRVQRIRGGALSLVPTGGAGRHPSARRARAGRREGLALRGVATHGDGAHRRTQHGQRRRGLRGRHRPLLRLRARLGPPLGEVKARPR